MIAKITNIPTSEIINFTIFIAVIAILVGLFFGSPDFCEKDSSSKPHKKDYVNCIEIEVRGHKRLISIELYNRLGKRGVPTLGEVLSLSPKTKRKSQAPTNINHFIKDKENSNSHITPFPTKRETPKRANEESMQEIIENHKRRLDDLDYIFAEIDKNKYWITTELESFLKNGYKNKNLRKDFDEYIRNNPPESLPVKTFDLTKAVNPPNETPRVNPIISDLINQIQMYGDNIIVKQQGQQLTIKATLNQEKKAQENQWGEF